MLDELHLTNFRCFRDLKAPLRPLTVLIGPNDSGKSAFLQAIVRFLSRDTQFALKDRWRLQQDVTVSFVGKAEDGLVVINSDQGLGADTVRIIERELTPVAMFQLPSHGPPLQCQGYAEGEEAQLELGADGRNVPALLDYFLRKDRKRLDAIVTAMRNRIPGLEDLDIATPSPDSRRVDFVIENGLRIAAEYISVGVRLLLFFVALAYHPRPPKTILIEEPENGVHPKRLADIVTLLREITQGEHGDHAAQVILTTHSPYLLDAIDIQQDQVLVFQRNDDGSRSAQPADEARLKHFLDEFMLGEIWYNETEEGLVARP